MKTMEKPILSNERRKTISKAIELCLESFNRKEAISRIVDFVEDEKKLTYDVAKFKNAYNELSKKIETMKNQSEWRVAPPYENEKWTIVSAEHELIATFEDADTCFLVAKLFNEKKQNTTK
jgi:hypothetical protein